MIAPWPLLIGFALQVQQTAFTLTDEFYLIASFYINVAAIVLTVILTVIVVHYHNKQQRAAEEYYMNETLKNAHDIASTFKEILRRSHVRDLRQPSEVERATYSLESYFKKNVERINKLVTHSEACLERWISLKMYHRNNMNDAISDLHWLTADYFPDGKSFNTKKRSWPDHYDDLVVKESRISKIVDALPEPK